VLLAYENYGPRYMRHFFFGHDRYSPLPKLQHWSDIAYLQWCEAAQRCSEPPALQFVIRYSVRNETTNLIVNRALRDVGRQGEPWPGVVFTMDTDQGRAILGSPNGSGVARLLSQHKVQFFQKTVSEVRVFYACTRDRYVAFPHLVFRIQDVWHSKILSGMEEGGALVVLSPVVEIREED